MSSLSLLNTKKIMRNKNRLEKVINRTLENNTTTVFAGTIKKISPLRNRKNKLRKGSTVITPQGLGTILSHPNKIWDDKPGNSIEVMLNRKYPKYFPTLETSQLAIFHKPSNQFILLSPQCYGYIFKEGMNVSYRITKRKYAMLTDEFKAELKIINTIQKRRGGIQMLRDLDDVGAIIVLPGEELHYSPSKLINDLLQEKFNNLKSKLKRTGKTVFDKLKEMEEYNKDVF